MRVFQNRVLRKILGLRKMRMEKNHIMKTLMICSPYQILFKFQVSEDEMRSV